MWCSSDCCKNIKSAINYSSPSLFPEGSIHCNRFLKSLDYKNVHCILASMFTLFIVTTLLATSVVAKHCQNFTVPVSITARNEIFNVLPFETSLDVTSFVQDLLNIGGNTLGPTGTKTVSGQYNMSVEFCQPDSPKGKDPILQFLVHDIGFDKT